MEADYLVIGSGASAMAFVDVMLDETDATFAMVDRRSAPGGHWNDAYPFVRLHQPAATYGVMSKPLGADRVETRGNNRGLMELSSGVEIAHYYHQLMDDVFLPSGRVQYLPMCEYQADSGVVSLLSGEVREVTVRRKVVHGTHLTTSIPMTHERRFTVAQGVACEPPNHLPRLAPRHRHVTVLGAGKTALDSLVWLLEQGFPPERITWVMPRDAWYWNRNLLQPGMRFFDATIGNKLAQNEASAAAASPEDLCLRMEADGAWLRLDTSVWPTLYHAAVITEMDLEALRRIDDVVRLGRVLRIEADRMVLEQGERATPPDTLFVDCTASAVEGNVGDFTPVFAPGRIDLQMIRPYQPCFSSALIAHMEATLPDDASRDAFTRVTPMTDRVEDWIRCQAVGLANQAAWNADENLATWLRACRLDPAHHIIKELDLEDAEKLEMLGRLVASAPAAQANLERLGAAVPVS